MPRIIHLGHSPAALLYDPARVRDRAGGFDPTLDNFCFGTTRPANGASARDVFLPFSTPRWSEPALDLWVSFRQNQASDQSGPFNLANPSPKRISFIGADGQEVNSIQLHRGNSSSGVALRNRQDNEVSGTVGSIAAALFLGSVWVDIHWRLVGDVISVEIYFDSVAVYSASMTQSGSTGVIQCGIQWPMMLLNVAGATIDMDVAHVAVTDGIPTTGRRWARFRPAAQGYINEWLGSFQDVQDNNPNTQMRALSPDLRTAFTVEPAFAGTPSGSLGAVHLVSTVQGAPLTRARQFARIGTDNFDGPLHTLASGGAQTNVHTMPVRPHDNSPWTLANIQEAQFGLLSVAAE